MFEILCLSCIPSKFEEVAIKIDSAMPRTWSNMGFFSTQGQVTLKHIVHIGRNLNLSKILCLGWIPACLKKLRSKVKALCLKQGQIWFFLALKGKLILDEL